MARSHGQVLASVWEDPDWISMSAGAQRLYMLLLSQKKLSLAGCLVYTPARWARLAPDTTVDEVERAARELHDRRFIAVDDDTCELVIRTLVRHDGVRHTANRNLLLGLWSAWDAIESQSLRQVVIDNLPDEVWESVKVSPPAEAVEMRRSDQPKPPVPTAGSDRQSEPPVPTNGSNRGSEPRGRARSTSHLPPTNPLPSTVHSTGDPATLDDEFGIDSLEGTPDERAHRAIEWLAWKRTNAATGVDARDRYQRKIAQSLRDEHWPRALANARTGWRPRDIAARIENPAHRPSKRGAA